VTDCDGTMYTLHEIGFQADGEIIPGKMKLEGLFTEGIYLKPKLYAQYNAEDNGEAEFHAKGVKLYQNRELTRIETYRRVLEEERVEFAVNTNIQKTKKLGSVHNVTLIQRKVAMDSYDNKRLWTSSNSSMPYGMDTVDKNTIEHRLANNLCCRIQKYVDIPSGTITTYLGCSMKELMAHLKKGWIVTGVNCCWQNYGECWNIDHIAPVSVLKTDKTLRTIKRICHYKNMQAMSVSENSSKKDVITPEIRAYLYGKLAAVKR